VRNLKEEQEVRHTILTLFPRGCYNVVALVLYHCHLTITLDL
jgi:hypothetical protein